MEIKLTAE